jgi:hypothetical protein
MNIEEVIEQHARKIVAAAARAQVRKAVPKYYVYVWIRPTTSRIRFPPQWPICSTLTFLSG